MSVVVANLMCKNLANGSPTTLIPPINKSPVIVDGWQVLANQEVILSPLGKEGNTDAA